MDVTRRTTSPEQWLDARAWSRAVRHERALCGVSLPQLGKVITTNARRHSLDFDLARFPICAESLDAHFQITGHLTLPHTKC